MTHKKIALTLSFLFIFSILAIAQNCNAGNRIARKVWQRTGAWTNPVSLVPFTNQFKIKKKVWNAIVGNSSATWGPRHINLNKKESGTVHGGTKRTFVSDPLFYNNARIKLDKTGGRGRTLVLICTHDDDGTSRGVQEYEFQNSGTTSSKTFRIPNVRGKIVSISISCKTALRSFTYGVKLENYN